MFDTNYFLEKLRKGESMDTIGQALANAMNEAQKAYEEEQTRELEEQRRELHIAAKREVAKDLVKALFEYGRLCDYEYDESFADIDDVMMILDDLFESLASLATVTELLKDVQPEAPASDDEVLANFIKLFS